MRKENEALLAKVFKGVQLSEAEQGALFWLAGWETDTLKGIISVFKKLSK